MTFQRRLLLAQLPLAGALLLVGAASLRTVTSLGRSSEAILADNYRSALAAQRMAAELDRLDRDALLRVAGQHPVDAAGARARFEAELALQASNITEAGEASATERLRAAWEEYRRVEAALDGSPDPLAYAIGPLQRASAAVRAATDEIQALNQAAMAARSAGARRDAHRLLGFMAAATLAALALGLVASAALTSSTVRPLSALSRAVREFGEGRLAARVGQAGGGEIAALGREFDTMADRLERYRRSTLGELLQAQQSVQAAIDALPDPVLVQDARGTVLNLNSAAEALLGLGRDQGVDQPLPALDGALRGRLDAARAHVLAGNGPYVPRGFEEAVRVDLADGPRRLLPRATALRSAEGAVTGTAVVLQDVTRLARIDELRNDLVSTIAHEFRTPLTSLQMAVHLCSEGTAGPVTDPQSELLAGARQDCERLQTLVEDILDLSRIQAGRMAIAAGPAEVDALVARAVAAAEPAACEKRIALTAQTDGVTRVLADVERIGVVLGNLLGNALRHTPAGGSVAVRAAAAGPAVRIEVQDSGPGVAPEHREQIFERFFQVPGTTRGGAGLGLFIARQIVEAHGGAIGVEGGEGRGSTFWFTLPATGPRAA